METDDFPTFSTKLSNCEQYSHFYSFSTSQASEDCTNCENKYEKNACKHDIPNHACKSDKIKINEDIDASSSYHLEETISETVSERICCILSPRSFKNESIATQNGVSSKRFVEIFNNEEQTHRENMIMSQCGDKILRKCEKNMIISQSCDRTSNDSDREDKSTALLLKEALHFKKVLLTRIDSAKEQSIRQETSENDIMDESSREYQQTEKRENDNFPSMILDIKTEKPVISDSYDQMNQHYVYLEMKQQHNQSVRSKQLNILTHHENERENKDRICETASKYFSITDFAIRGEDNDNDDVKIGSNVLSSLKPPIYEKVISIIIPVDARNRDEISTKDKEEKSMQMNDAARDVHANSSANLRKHNDTNDNVTGYPPATRKLENLVLERIKNIRDYIDTFLRNQNKAISKVRRALQYRSESDAMMLALRCSNEASHVISHKRLKIAISNHNNCIDQAVSFSNNSPDLLLKAWPTHREVLKDDVLKYCSNICLRKDLEMFALMAPTKSEVVPETIAELKKTQIDSSPSITFERSYEKNAKSMHKITDELHLNELHSMKCIELNEETDHTNKLAIVDTLNTDFHEKQPQNVQHKSSAVWSRYLFDSEKIDTKIIETVHEKLPAITNDNSISNSSSYFTNTTLSSIKMDDILSKSTSNLKQSREVSIEQKETEQNQVIDRESNFVEKFLNMNTKTNELSSNLEYSNLKILVDSNFIPGESECDCSTSTKTLNENDIPYDLGVSPLHSSLKGKTDDDSLNSTERNKKIFADTAHTAPDTEPHSTRQFLHTHPQIKAKSDVSLNILDVSLNVPTDKRKNVNSDVKLQPKGSLSLLTHHDSLAHIQRTLHQSHANAQYDDKNKFTENKVQLANRSKSVVPSQRASTRSCIPISKNRLEPIRRVRHQMHARSPTRGPLTVSCRENTFSKSHTADNKEVSRRRSTPINRHLHTEEVALDLIELDMQKDIFAKNLERTDKSNAAYKDNNVTSQENYKFLCNENNETKPSIIDKKHLEKKSMHVSTCTEHTDSKSNRKITERDNATHKTVAVISIMTDKDMQKNYPANSFILKTEDVCSATDLLEHKNKLWTIAIERTEKEITAKPSITDTCTSMSEVTLKTN